jgi:hypothetical protein
MLDMASGYKSAAIRAKQKQCMANLSQLDEYNIESTIAGELESSNKKPLSYEQISGKPVPEEMKCPFNGNYIYEYASGTNVLSCTFHGNYYEKKSLDPGYSIFYWLFKWIKNIFR